MRRTGILSVAPDLIEVFAEAVSQYPDHHAVVHNGRALSYLQLNATVQAAARRLGDHPGVVGVLTTRTPGTIVGLLAVLTAGGVYCPIDPAVPIARQRAMLSAVRCQRVLATEPGFLSLHGAALIDLHDLPPFSGSDTAAAVDPADPAYILFTSGSTGEPKPVVTPRQAIAITVRELQALFALTPADRVLQFASLNWDTCLEEILPTLTTGGALVFNDDAYSGSFPRFLRMIESEQITVLDLPTAFWHELVHHLAEDRLSLPPCVRVMVIGGESVNPARLAEWRDLDTSHIRLINTYGCTETTLITHAVDLHGPGAGAFPNGEGRVPIGRALPHVVEHISDAGELLIGGPALALGYQGRLEATEARFVVVDSCAGAGRFFRTGDRVSRSDDGLLSHLGRIDNEVKVRGIRVDPAEVEAHIASHPGVSAVAVVGVMVTNRMTLVAHVVARSGAEASTLAIDVRAFLRTRVPSHLVPSRITVVPDLVYTASGKIDRGRSHRQYAVPEHVTAPAR